MASYLYVVRAMEVTDNNTRMAIDLIHRLDTCSEKQIHRGVSRRSETRRHGL